MHDVQVLKQKTNISVVFHLPSDNGGNITKDMVHEAELPVKYAVYIIVTA